MADGSKKILAVASAGGHWHQLCQLCAAFPSHEIHYVTTLHGLPETSGKTSSSIIYDCNQNRPIRAMVTAMQMFRILLRERPDVVISTGALPGLIAVGVAWSVRKPTIWVDSVANAEEPSSSGRTAKRFVSLWLSQWDHVAQSVDGLYEGSVL